MADPSIMWQQESPVWQSLAIALQHPAVANQWTICRMLQVSKGWRAAVQRSKARLSYIARFYRVGVMQDFDRWPSDVERFSNFAAWISAFPQLVENVSIIWKRSRMLPRDSDLLYTARHALEENLQLAAAGSEQIVPDAETAVAPLLAVPQHQQSPWRLRSFTCNIFVSPAVISALPAATLTQLIILVPVKERRTVKGADPWAVPNNIIWLDNLQHLGIGSVMRVQQSVATGLSNLAQLTRLDIQAIIGENNLQLMLESLPHQLRQISIKPHDMLYDGYEHSSFMRWAGDVVADLRYLHLLTTVKLDLSYGRLSMGSAMPSQLQCLEVFSSADTINLLNLSGLEQLRDFSVGYMLGDAVSLQAKCEQPSSVNERPTPDNAGRPKLPLRYQGRS